MAGANGQTEAEYDPRRSTVWFIGAFVVIVLALLTGYRFSIETPANDRYLFTVATHTAWLLNHIGHRGELEANQAESHMDPRRMRAETAAWQHGADTPTPAELAAASNTPTSVWERYEHRLLSARRAKSKVVGPHVSFVWKPGLEERVSIVESKLAALEARTDLAPNAKDSTRKSLQGELDSLHALQEDVVAHPDLRLKYRAKAFSFIIIAECGAIEVMAIFLAAVAAFPTRWWKRLVGLLIGLPIMYGVNILRLSCLGMIGAMDPSGKWFNFAHEYVWQAVYIVFVVMVWLAWIEFVVRERRDDAEEAGDEEAA